MTYAGRLFSQLCVNVRNARGIVFPVVNRTNGGIHRRRIPILARLLQDGKQRTRRFPDRVRAVELAKAVGEVVRIIAVANQTVAARVEIVF